MTDIQQNLFQHLMETRVRHMLPSGCYRHFSGMLEQQETALLETMTAAQKALFASYQDASAAVCDLEQQAMFLATWAAARELL